jgi:hypothetical protein
MGIAPSEFWRMTPSEFDVLWMANKPEERRGNLGEHQLESLYDELETGDYL